MAEAFVKTFKRDYAYLSDLPNARAVLEQLDGWFDDYDAHHPHKALMTLSPKEFRRSRSA